MTIAISSPTNDLQMPSQTTPVRAGTAYVSDDARYQAVAARDPAAEGHFFYSVATTGVYCRPTCPARLARRDNVAFHASVEAAERAGFRACLRCRPREPGQHERHARLVDAARARLDGAAEAIRLDDLAGEAGLSPFHFHRLFRRHVGLTPRQYAAAVRLRRFDEHVRESATVTEAIYEAGYSSSSRFYEGGGALGLSPSQLRRGGQGATIRFVVRRCALGQMLVAATERGVCLVAFDDDRGFLEAEVRRRFPEANLLPADGGVRALAERMVALVDEGTVPSDLPLDLLGTTFQQKVWRALREIPRGGTTTYAELARRIGSPRAVRAVGTACGANPVSVVVPCHRVLRGDGDLGGYRWGLPRKRALLAQESAEKGRAQRGRTEQGEAAEPRRAPAGGVDGGRGSGTGLPAARALPAKEGRRR